MHKDMAHEYEKMRRFNRSTRSAEFTRPESNVYLSEYGVRKVHTIKGAGEKSLVCGTLRSTWRAPSHYDKGTAKNRVAHVLSETAKGRSSKAPAAPDTRPRASAYERAVDGTADVSIQAVPITSSEIYYENDVKSQFKDQTLRSGWQGHRSPVQRGIVLPNVERTESKKKARVDSASTKAPEDSSGRSSSERDADEFGKQHASKHLIRPSQRREMSPTRFLCAARPWSEDMDDRLEGQDLDEPDEDRAQVSEGPGGMQQGIASKGPNCAGSRDRLNLPADVFNEYDVGFAHEDAPGKSRRGAGISGYKGVRPLNQRRDEDRPIQADGQYDEDAALGAGVEATRKGGGVRPDRGHGDRLSEPSLSATRSRSSADPR